MEEEEKDQGNDSSSEYNSSDFEEVLPDEVEAQPRVPPEGLTITVPRDGIPLLKGRRKKNDLNALIRREINRSTRELQEVYHKVHLLSLISVGLRYNRILRSELVLSSALSTLPSVQAYPPKHMNLSYIEKFIQWFRKIFKVQALATKGNSEVMSPLEMEELVVKQLQNTQARDYNYLVCLFVAILRSLGIECRLVWSLNPVSLKPPSESLLRDPELKRPRQEKLSPGSQNDSKAKGNEKKTEEPRPSTSKGETVGKESTETLKTVKKSNGKKGTPVTRRVVSKTKRLPTDSSEISTPDDSDLSDFDSPKPKRKRTKKRRELNASTKTPAKRTIMTRQGTSASSTKPSAASSSNKPSESPPCKLKKSESPGGKLKKSSTPSRLMELNESRSESRCKTVDKKTKSKDCSSSTPKLNLKDSKVDLAKVDPIDEEKSSPGTSVKPRITHDFWVEVYLEEEELWVSVDLSSGSVMCNDELERKATPPVDYVLAFGNQGYLKDVTRRYASQWLTATQKRRVDSCWWNESLAPFSGKRTARDEAEDNYLDNYLLKQGIPKTMQEVKGHPLYVMERHLLKFEALAPKALPVGFLNNEPVFSRESVKPLHTKDRWMREAKAVRRDEKPYKIVKSRPKYDKQLGILRTDCPPVELYGEWQTEDYIPMPAVNGKVPRNDYGNVELFQEKMLPGGTVHLRVPGLNRIARKLDIDCPRAVVGFDYHAGSSHPTFDGYVVCEEVKDILLDAYNEELDKERKEKEKEKAKEKEKEEAKQKGKQNSKNDKKPAPKDKTTVKKRKK